MTETSCSQEGGFALPLVLFGLISLSLLATTAVITSTSERTSAAAYGDATRDLYAVDAALQRYIGDYASDLQADAGLGEFLYAPTSHIPPALLSVALLASLSGPDGQTARIYAVAARPASGAGRTVKILVRETDTEWDRPLMHVPGAVVVAGDLSIDAGAFAIDGSGRGCDGSGVAAVHGTAESSIELPASLEDGPLLFRGLGVGGEESEGDGAVTRSAERDDLIREVLGGSTPAELAARVPADLWRYRSRAPAFTTRWLTDALSGSSGVAVIDAEGGTIRIGAGTYTGLLIVLNGGVELADNITYEGILLVEGSFELRGEVAVRGALLGLGLPEAGGGGGPRERSTIGSEVEVAFDLCAVKAGFSAYWSAVGRPGDPRRITAWLELVR